MNGTQQIMGNYGRIPAIGKAAYSPVGSVPTALSPDQKPLSATQFSGGWRQLQLTVFYRLLPRSGRNQAFGCSRIWAFTPGDRVLFRRPQLLGTPPRAP